jgi:hypothetical protein
MLHRFVATLTIIPIIIIRGIYLLNSTQHTSAKAPGPDWSFLGGGCFSDKELEVSGFHSHSV